MSTDAERIAEGLAAAWSSGDVEKIASFFTDDWAYEDVCAGAVYRGQGQLKAAAKAVLDRVPDLKLEIKSLFASGDWIGAEWIETGTRNSKRFSLQGASIAELDEGKIKRESIYTHFDGATWLDG